MYRAKLANAARAIGAAGDISGLPCSAAQLDATLRAAKQLGGPAAGTPVSAASGQHRQGLAASGNGVHAAAQQDAALSSRNGGVTRAVLDALFQSAETAVTAVLGTVKTDRPTAVGATAAVAEAVEKLENLRQQPVTAALVKETGLGLRLNSLSKQCDGQLRQAVKAVMHAWKERVREQRQS